MEREREVIRNLPARRNNDALRLFKFDDIENALERKLFKIQPVRHVIVCRDRFRIVVNHNSLEFFLFECFQSLHARPIKLD